MGTDIVLRYASAFAVHDPKMEHGDGMGLRGSKPMTWNLKFGNMPRAVALPQVPRGCLPAPRPGRGLGRSRKPPAGIQ